MSGTYKTEDDYFDAVVDLFAEACGAVTHDQRRHLRLALKHVERDTRHIAFEAAQECMQAVQNIDPWKRPEVR